MAKVSISNIRSVLSDSFADVWKLLSETSTFLSRTSLLPQYENQLREWRQQLQSSPKNTELVRAIRAEIVDLRKALRLQGYDLSLGSQILQFDGFRNDASVTEGFARLVLFIGDSGVYYISGSDNHVTLSEFLDNNLEKAGNIRIRERHFLWYQRRGNVLVLSGSDTETKENFERLERIGNANPLLLLSGLKNLK